MLPEDLPKCICGSHAWESGGATIGRMTQQSFACSNCGREGLFLSAHSCDGFLTATDMNSHMPYLNRVLLVTWRAWGEKIEAARDEFVIRKSASFFDAFNLPADTKREQMSKEVEQAADIFWDQLYNHDEYRRPSGFKDTPLPPKLPAGLSIFLMRGSKDNRDWYLVNRADTEKLEIPPDPVRTRHDECYGPIFPKLAQQLGVDILRREVPNQYCGASNEPWFEFELGQATFTVGPRKRVTAIKVKAPLGIATDAIRAVAQADDTTYEAYGQAGVGGWQAEIDPAYTLEIHAWGREKLEEYLLLLGQAALQSQSALAEKATAEEVAEHCPPGCGHETFHYCNQSGTHCDKHCACKCEQCARDRQNPTPVDPTTGGAILPGSNVAT